MNTLKQSNFIVGKREDLFLKNILGIFLHMGTWYKLANIIFREKYFFPGYSSILSMR